MNSKIQYTYVFLLVLFTTIIVSCANMGTPDGGPYDETPPKIVSTSPDFGASNSHPKKITLMFDENIKLDNPGEKVIVSPPQIEQPEIFAAGKKITIELLDSLLPNKTYTIDFADAIEDNNEGNPMGDYAFSFSTGEHIDTMQVSGYVLDASNLEPIKGILVGLYSFENDSELPDSVFQKESFQRISRTDSRGHFTIKGIAPGSYKVYALKDQDQNYMYSQKSEMIAFSDKVIVPTCNPDVRPDTVWHDSIHYDSIMMKPYTHFYPDDIMLLAFTTTNDDVHLLKYERNILNKFTLYFTGKPKELPIIKGLNFDENDAFIIQHTPNNDTISYWIRDSLLYYNDTLDISMTYYQTDTLGNLSLCTDTLNLVSKQTKARFDKLRKEEYDEWADEYRSEQRSKRKNERNEDGKKIKLKDEDIPLPPKPEKFMDVKVSNTNIDPDVNIDFSFPEPINQVFLEYFHLDEIIDSTRFKRELLFVPIENEDNKYRLYAEWQPGSVYELSIDTGAVVSIYGNRMVGMKGVIRVKELDTYSSLFVSLQNVDTCAIVQLLNSADDVVKEVKAKKGKADFYFITPGTYYLRMFYDRNGDGIWSSGDYEQHIQAEETYYYPGALELRAQWDINQSWNPTAYPIFRQKPGKITKQKPDKEKTINNKNAQRLKEKHKN